MVAVSFINPLSDEGRQIVRKLGNMNTISMENGILVEIAIHSKSQDISDESIIPHNYLDLAVKRVEWYLKKKNDRNFNYKKYAFLFNQEITGFDVVAFYLLSQAIGVKFGPNSRESRVMIESQGSLMESRLGDLSRNDRKEVVLNILSSLLTQDHNKWTFFADLLSSRRINLQDLVMDDGNIILYKEDFMQRFQGKIQNRDPERMYELLIGNQIKELIVVKMVMQKTEDYLAEVYEKSRKEIEPNPILLDLAERVSEVLNQPMMSFGYGGGTGDLEASPLNPKAFPPCVKTVLEGMKSGGRNDAIILFLTPFISYARLYPDVFRRNVTRKVSEVDPHLAAVQNEILPLIYGAADRCNPPLFEDQPQEKVNINAKLGFGMHTSLELNHEGESTWYTPMSCEKVKLHLPTLCKPDETCKKIGNPLSYYTRKSWQFKKDEKENRKGE